MNLIKINLLPYREQREAKQKKEFQSIMALGFLLGVLACGAVYMTLQQAVENQESRNSSLQTGIDELQKEIEKIKDLRDEKQKYLARKQKVEELDNKRFDGARIVDGLNQVVPDGAYLTALRGKGADGSGSGIEKEYMLEGEALSDHQVSLLMSALPSTGMFDLPQLGEIKNADDAQSFVLKSTLVEQIVLPPPAASAPAAAASAAK